MRNGVCKGYGAPLTGIVRGNYGGGIGRRSIYTLSDQDDRQDEIDYTVTPNTDSISKERIRMAYFLNLFSPETYEAFAQSDRTVSGFRPRHQNAANRVKTGDKLVCYMTKLSRWFGVLEVIEGPYHDDRPIFYQDNDPFVVRFRVRTVVLLPVKFAIPIFEDTVWNNLSFTKGLTRASHWTGKVRTSLVPIDDEDGQFLESFLLNQTQDGMTYPLSEEDYQRHFTHKVRRADKDVAVTVPESREDLVDSIIGVDTEVRESTHIQALLAEIGYRMGMQIWIPRADRTAVLKEWKGNHDMPLERLPLNYDETTLRTIEQIDIFGCVADQYAERLKLNIRPRSTQESSAWLTCSPCSQTWISSYISLHR